MINILFVDDEPNILQGLERMLRSMRHEWRMWFASSGEETLSLLQAQNIEVVVLDIRMPQMDGAQLLTEIRFKYPHVIRIILSGYPETKIIMKTVGAAHQYLSKPCDADVLKSTIERVCSLRKILNNEVLRSLIAQIPNVPSLPDLYSALIEELNKSEPCTQKVAGIIKKDIGITVKVLQMVNSAFFGLKRHVSDSKQAIEYLGLDTITSLTLGIGVISQFESQPSLVRQFAHIWAHGMAVGVTANKIARSVDSQTAADAFTAGLLHDIGEVVLAAYLPQEFSLVRKLMTEEKLSKVEAERQTFNATPAEVGAYLLGLWGLPKSVVEAVAYHEYPGELQSDSFTALTAVHAANAIHHYAKSEKSGLTQPEFDNEYLKKLGLLEKTPVWLEKYSNLDVD